MQLMFYFKKGKHYNQQIKKYNMFNIQKYFKRQNPIKQYLHRGNKHILATNDHFTNPLL